MTSFKSIPVSLHIQQEIKPEKTEWARLPKRSSQYLMYTLKDESKNTYGRLNAEQRQQIYEEEKHRIEQFSPRFSENIKIMIVAYLLGCVLIYFGIPRSFIKPEADLLLSLFNSVLELIRPLLVGYICLLPFCAIFGVFGYDIFKYLRKFKTECP